jgi:FtsP/CotA-like multicopper oxidase with cupredoxin domain
MSTHTTRRNFLSSATLGTSLLLSGCRRNGASAALGGPADVTLRIANVLVDIAKDHTISTIGYNGSVPGPLIRLREGVPVTVDLLNYTDVPELVHWHGQAIPAEVDGAEEEKSLAVPAHGPLRYRLTPGPSGARFVHTHAMPMANLARGTYTGQFAFVYIEPKSNPGRYDQEIFLATHEWEPFYTTAEDEEEEPGAPPPPKKKDETPNGWEIGYQRFTINASAWAMASRCA